MTQGAKFTCTCQGAEHTYVVYPDKSISFLDHPEWEKEAGLVFLALGGDTFACARYRMLWDQVRAGARILDVTTTGHIDNRFISVLSTNFGVEGEKWKHVFLVFKKRASDGSMTQCTKLPDMPVANLVDNLCITFSRLWITFFSTVGSLWHRVRDLFKPERHEDRG